MNARIFKCTKCQFTKEQNPGEPLIAKCPQCGAVRETIREVKASSPKPLIV